MLIVNDYYLRVAPGRKKAKSILTKKKKKQNRR